jgi:hypothetical protein
MGTVEHVKFHLRNIPAEAFRVGFGAGGRIKPVVAGSDMEDAGRGALIGGGVPVAGQTAADLNEAAHGLWVGTDEAVVERDGLGVAQEYGWAADVA